MEWPSGIGGAGQGAPRTEEIFSGGTSVRGERFDLAEKDVWMGTGGGGERGFGGISRV